MKKFIRIYIPVFLVLLVIFSFVSPIISTSESISEKVFRLHILANSDSDEDQRLKLKVRDYILENATIFDECSSVDDAVDAAINNIEYLNKLADDCIEYYGYDYPVSFIVDEEYFATREYEDITLPAGNYQTLKIVIGEGEGHNWWCIVFPAVCLSACSEDELSQYLTDDEIELIDNDKSHVTKFKIIEIYENIKNKLN